MRPTEPSWKRPGRPPGSPSSPGSDLSPLEFAQQSEGFLATRRSGATVGDPKEITFNGQPAARTIVSYPGAKEQVTFVSEGNTVYALIKRVEGGASAQVENEADAALVKLCCAESDPRSAQRTGH